MRAPLLASVVGPVRVREVPVVSLRAARASRESVSASTARTVAMAAGGRLSSRRSLALAVAVAGEEGAREAEEIK